MTNLQLYMAIGVPVVMNFVVTLALWTSLRSNMNDRFDGVNEKFAAVNQRFDDMRDLWRAELHRVEEVLDARLRHIEEARS